MCCRTTFLMLQDFQQFKYLEFGDSVTKSLFHTTCHVYQHNAVSHFLANFLSHAIPSCPIFILMSIALGSNSDWSLVVSENNWWCKGNKNRIYSKILTFSCGCQGSSTRRGRDIPFWERAPEKQTNLMPLNCSIKSLKSKNCTQIKPEFLFPSTPSQSHHLGWIYKWDQVLLMLLLCIYWAW